MSEHSPKPRTTTEPQAYCDLCGRLVTEFIQERDLSLHDVFVGLAEWADVQAEGFRPGSEERQALTDVMHNLQSWSDHLPLALQVPFTLKHRHASTN